MQDIVLHAWRRKNALFYLVLIPLSWIFGLVTAVRRFCYQTGLLKSQALSVPVIVVGNINMGGSGKTPVVIWLVEQLKSHGYKPGVISRGYGAKSVLPTPVNVDSEASLIGDEPLLIAQRCHCPVWVGADRALVGMALLKAHPECNVIISDDGLQHYGLKRDVEIAVVDKEGLNKPQLLPAGPLRESIARLDTVDVIICNGTKTISSAYEMQMVGQQFYNLADENLKATASDFKRKSIKAMAGIAHPERFFEHLHGLGLTFAAVSFEDHHAYDAQDLAQIDCDVLMMTEKDAVKCKSFAQAHHWVLPVEAQIDGTLLPIVLEKTVRK